MSRAAPGAAALVELAALLRAWLDGGEVEIGPVTAEAIGLAQRQRVAPLLYRIASEGRGPGRDALLEATRAAHYRTLLLNDRLLALAATATAALGQAGVATIRLKGADLLIGIYPHHAVRPMDDVDLLVSRDDVPVAVAALERAGFLPSDDALPLAALLEHHFHVPFTHPASERCLELHWELMDHHKRGALSGAAVWSQAVAMDPERPELGLRLDAELGFLYLALHLSKHGPYHEIVRARKGAAAALLHPSSEGRLLWLVDLALLARKRPPDAARLAAQARAAGVERSAAESLALARDLLGSERFPQGVLEPTRPGAWRKALSALVARLLLSDSAAGWLAPAGRMHETALVRPLRMLELPLLVFPPFGEFRRERALGRARALLCYPQHVLGELRKLGRFAIAVARHRRLRRGAGR